MSYCGAGAAACAGALGAGWYWPPPPCPPSPPPRYSLRVISAVAHFRLGATSSATISTLLPALAVLVLPGALVESAVDDDSRALRERVAHVLRELSPAGDVEIGDLVFGSVASLQIPRHAEVRNCSTPGVKRSSGSRVRFPYDGDGVVDAMVVRLSGSYADAGVPRRPRRVASPSGNRMILWRTTSSARRSARSWAARSLRSGRTISSTR